MCITEVAYLGPIGTYSNLVAQKYYGAKTRMVPMATILDVCSFVSRSATRRGIIPSENSSGGAIYETVDILLENRPRIHIEHEITLDVQLALIGRKNETPKVLYSHFAPLEHCDTWIRKTLGRIQRRQVSSTAVAALHAAAEPSAVALGSRKLASLYSLDILHYPVEADLPNVTTFYAIAGKRFQPQAATKTALAVKLPNTPGSLCSFLDTFRAENVNLSRLISRPIRGCPREYAFLVDVQGTPTQPPTKRALQQARKVSTDLRIVGTYPCSKKFKS